LIPVSAVLHRSLIFVVCGALLALPALATSQKADVRVALLPIEVHAEGNESDYLRSGLQEMLAARLEQFDGVSVVQPDVPGVRDAEAAVAAAQAAGAEFVLYGSFTRFGDGASLDLHCVSAAASGEAGGARRVFVHSGTLAEIIPQLDTLAEKVARYALAPARPVRSDGASPAAGPSDEAFQSLIKRVDALERAARTPVAAGAQPQPKEPAAAGAAVGPVGPPVR
jgi:TolB-like protein